MLMSLTMTMWKKTKQYLWARNVHFNNADYVICIRKKNECNAFDNVIEINSVTMLANLYNQVFDFPILKIK